MVAVLYPLLSNPEDGVPQEVGLSPSQFSSRALATRCAELLDEKKLEDITIFDVGESIQITDYFVIASGQNSRHIQNVSSFISKTLRDEGVGRCGLEGYQEGKWILLDYDDVVVHLFLVDNRRYYDLELLWGDCPKVPWSPATRQRPSRGQSSVGAGVSDSRSSGAGEAPSEEPANDA